MSYLHRFIYSDASSFYWFIVFLMKIDLTKAVPPEQNHKAD